MSIAGVETYNADGTLQLSATDRLSKFVVSGELYIPVLFPIANAQRRVNVPGMTRDGTWFVTGTGSCYIEIFEGYFIYTRVDRYEWSGPPFEREGDYMNYTVGRL